MFKNLKGKVGPVKIFFDAILLIGTGRHCVIAFKQVTSSDSTS